MQQIYKLISLAAPVLLLAVLGGCGSSPDKGMTTAEFQRRMASQAEVDQLNQKLMAAAVEASVQQTPSVYHVGPGDELRVTVLNVGELSGVYLVDGRGRVSLPLIGTVDVAGLTVPEVEQHIAQRYSESYLRNPVVSVHVTEYRSQQFTIVGAVEEPRVYSVQRQTTLIEALAKAGGLTKEAGSTVYLTDRVTKNGSPQVRTMIVGMRELMRHPDKYNVTLGESALINVPDAGVVYVAGAVEEPGVYDQRADTTVLKAVTMAGGTTFAASGIKVLSRDPETGEWIKKPLNMEKIRSNPTVDVRLSDGDIVFVESNDFKAGLASAWENLAGIALFLRPF